MRWFRRGIEYTRVGNIERVIDIQSGESRVLEDLFIRDRDNKYSLIVVQGETLDKMTRAIVSSTYRDCRLYTEKK